MMKRKYLEPARLSLGLLAIVALSTSLYLRGSSGSATEMNDRRYSTDLKELRAQFNRDKGKVRLLLLLSPT